MWSLVLPLCAAPACRDGGGDGDGDDGSDTSVGSTAATQHTETTATDTLTTVGPDTSAGEASSASTLPGTTDETTETDTGAQCGDGARGSGELCFAPAVTLIADRPTAAVVVADFDGDGHADVAGAHPDGISITFGDGLGAFDPPTEAGDSATVQGLAAALLDGDTAVDLVAAHGQLGEIAVLLGLGDGEFAPPSPIALEPGAAPHTLAIVDVDGDGMADIVVVDDLAGRIHIVQQDDAGGFAAAASFDIGGNPLGLAAGRIDAQNGPDLALSNFAGASVGLLVHTGGLGYDIADSLVVGQGPRGIVLVDLDGDRVLDLATADAGGDTSTVVLGDGNGGFAAPLTLPVGAEPRAIASGDVDNDGTIDLALAGYGDNAAVVVLRDGSVDGFAFLPAQFVPTVVSPDDVAFGDFNEDGLGDLVLASAVAGGGAVVHTSDP